MFALGIIEDSIFHADILHIHTAIAVIFGYLKPIVGNIAIRVKAYIIRIIKRKIHKISRIAAVRKRHCRFKSNAVRHLLLSNVINRKRALVFFAAAVKLQSVIVI